MTRFAPQFLALLLCGTALCACASSPDIKASLGVKAKPVATKEAAAGDFEANLRQAQLLRLSGHYDEAVHTLSQLMLISSDDPRVVSEYGKTLAQQGRAQDATQFLQRAIELSANDWTLYSALGVSYDQLGDQTSARAAYEHALALKPGEASVLNNYALSRMLANDPAGAQNLMARAESAGGGGDEKIARNIALLKSLSPDAPQTAVAAAPKPAPMIAQTATPMPVTSQPLPNAAPRPLMPAPQFTAAPAHAMAQLPPTSSQQASNSTVVMQRVPEDPLAGPVKPRTHVAAQPKPIKTAAKPEAPVKTAAKKEAVPSLRMAADKY